MCLLLPERKYSEFRHHPFTSAPLVLRCRCFLQLRLQQMKLWSGPISLSVRSSRRQWSGWYRVPTLAALQRSSVRLSSTAHGCLPASCPTSSRTLTGEASSGPLYPELEEPRYDSEARMPRRTSLSFSCLLLLRSL